MIRVFSMLLVLIYSNVWAQSPVPDAAAASGHFDYVRIVSDADGETRFMDATLPLKLLDFAPPAPPNQISEHMPSTKVTFGKLPPNWFGDWHPTPRRQWIVLLQGSLEIETGDGEKRTFAAGEILLLEDVAGRGHLTRVTGDEVVHYTAVAVPE